MEAQITSIIPDEIKTADGIIVNVDSVKIFSQI